MSLDDNHDDDDPLDDAHIVSFEKSGRTRFLMPRSFLGTIRTVCSAGAVCWEFYTGHMHQDLHIPLPLSLFSLGAHNSLITPGLAN